MLRAYSQEMTSCGAHLLRASLYSERLCTTILASGGRVRSLRYFCVLSFPCRFSYTFTGSGYDLLASVRNITRKWTFLVEMMSRVIFVHHYEFNTIVFHVCTRRMYTVHQMYNTISFNILQCCNRIIVPTLTCWLQHAGGLQTTVATDTPS